MARTRRTRNATGGDAIEELKVFITNRDDSRCDECGDDVTDRMIALAGRERGALCLGCADLDHLAFLPAGDAAVTRRARAASTLSAVVLRWSRARKRYERQGVLVEEAALEQAESQCLADADARARRRDRERDRCAALDDAHVESFAARVRALFPACPAGRDRAIAERACLRSSGRVGRSAAGRELADDAVRLAVQAHARHAETAYDRHLAAGLPRDEARAEVADVVRAVLAKWSAPGG